MKKVLYFKNKKGFSLVEVVLSIGLFSVISLGLVSGLAFSTQSNKLDGLRARAIYLMDEGLEAVRSIRVDDIADLTDGTHGLDSSGAEWALSGSSDMVDGFTRTIEISSIDASTKEVTSTVTWPIEFSSVNQVSASVYLTNWRRETIIASNWETPTQAASLDFSGSSDGLKIQVLGNYVFIVRDGGNPDTVAINIQNASAPFPVDLQNLSNTTLDIAVGHNKAFIVGSSNNSEVQIYDVNPTTGALTFNSVINLPGNEDANGVTIDGDYAYVVRDQGSQDEFFTIQANVSSPYVVGSNDIYYDDANDVAVSGDFAFVALDAPYQDFVIMYVGYPWFPFLTSTVNVSGTDDITTVKIMNGMLAVGDEGGNFMLFNISNPYSPSLIDSVNVGDTINDMDYDPVSNYAFIVSDANAEEFQVYDFSNPSNITYVGGLNTAGDLNGVVFDTANNRVYAVGDDNSEEFIVINPF